jgi:mono/diheme cytochrome c family protein
MRTAPASLVLSTVIALTACASAGDELAGNDSELTASSWATVRASRQDDLDRFLAQNQDGYQAFMYAAFGAIGPPYIMYRLMPELFPELWGDANMSKLGMSKAPDSGHELPLGFGFQPGVATVPTPAGPVTFNAVTLTCATCHVGKVTGADGKETLLVGAPATTSKNVLTIAATVNHPRFTADVFRTAVLAKPAGWFYNDPKLAAQEAAERAIFTAPGSAESFVAQLKTQINAVSAQFASSLMATTYKGDDLGRVFGMPGSNDEFAFIAQLFATPQLTSSQLSALMPPKPAPTDLSGVFRRGDSPANWDSSNRSPQHRGVAAALLNQVNAATTNVKGGLLSGAFVRGLPPPPYPFDVDMPLARKGEALYGTYCRSCHESDGLFAPSEVGTDPNRALSLTEPSRDATNALLAQVCTDPAICTSPSPADYGPTGKYRAVKHDGLWTRAPYLHNGSVPTLRSLLLPSTRPAKFVRGNTQYDQHNVGFDWQTNGPETAVYDTSLDGNSNRGHDTPAFNGIDWSQAPDELEAILEYMKTL